MPSEGRPGCIDQPHHALLLAMCRTYSTAATAVSTARSTSSVVVKRPRLNLTDLERRVTRDAHREENLGGLDRAGAARTARRDRDRIHVGHDCLRIGALEPDVGRVREPPRDVSDFMNAGEPRLQRSGQSVTGLRDSRRLRRSFLRWRSVRRRRIPRRRRHSTSPTAIPVRARHRE